MEISACIFYPGQEIHIHFSENITSKPLILILDTTKFFLPNLTELNTIKYFEFHGYYERQVPLLVCYRVY